MSQKSVVDDIIQCPFNENHFVPRVSFQKHIIKCKRNYKGPKELVPCHFMASEYIEKDKMAEHMKECRYRTNHLELGYEPDKDVVDNMQEYRLHHINEHAFNPQTTKHQWRSVDNEDLNNF